MLYRIGAIALFPVLALLAACGGGGGGGPSAISTPPPVLVPNPKTPISVEAAPPALPPITTGTLRAALSGNADFRTGSTEIIDSIDSSTVSSRNKAYDSSTSIRIYYDATTDNYIVSNILGTVHRFPDGYSSGTRETYRAYGQNAVDGTRLLRVLTPSPTNPKIALTYMSYGVWQFDSSDRSNIDPQVNDFHFFYFGIPTAVDAMPRTGTAHYIGVAEGVLFDQARVFDLNGTASLDANFAGGSVATSLALGGTDRSNGLLIALPNIQGIASIGAGANAFVGTLNTADNSYVGSIQGAFFGPHAEETGFSFAINSPDLIKIGGGVAALKQ